MPTVLGTMVFVLRQVSVCLSVCPQILSLCHSCVRNRKNDTRVVEIKSSPSSKADEMQAKTLEIGGLEVGKGAPPLYAPGPHSL